MRHGHAAIAFVHRLAFDARGGTVIEYALVAFLVSIGIGFALPEIGASVREVLGDAATGVDRGVAAGEAG